MGDARSGLPRDAVAILGMSGRFPGARSVDELWSNLCRGEESITFFGRDELLEWGVDAALVDHASYVPAAGILDDVEAFDAAFFGISPREAELLDPQQRLFLESSHAALEHAGYDPVSFDGRIGVYGGSGMTGYLVENLLGNPELLEEVGPFQAILANDKDFLTTRVSYKLDLRGPSVTVQTACSTSLVAVALACQALLDGECDMALAGGVTVRLPHRVGYLHQEEGILSPDGHCRAFDAEAAGTVPGSGVGVVVLKPLARAFEDGDPIHAVIRGWALNNDGAGKVGYTAPSVEGQAAVIAEALEVAGIDPATIGYMETHGTGTRLGDPIEIAALRSAFGPSAGSRRARCAIGSLKTNLGHLDNAAGVAGLIKATLALEHGKIPPSLHFRRPNPEIDFTASPFRVATELAEWAPAETPRRAGVSSFGIGGTNAHLVLEEAPAQPSSDRGGSRSLVVLSARSEAALETGRNELAAHLESRPGLELEDVAYTLQLGRRARDHRLAVVAGSPDEAAEALRDTGRRPLTRVAGEEPRIAFLFPGQGAQHLGMGRDLYRESEVFRAELNRCAAVLVSPLGLDLRELLLADGDEEERARRLEQTALAQPALFAVEYALARLWMELDVEPEAMLGHSVGEYVAACLSGVLTLEEGLALMAARGRLVQALPGGSMLAVPLAEDELGELVGGGLTLAAVNAPRLSVVSGPDDEIDALRGRLEERGVSTRRLHTSHAFHSAMMEPAAAALRRELDAIDLRRPTIPFVSNLTGTWIQPEEAQDPDYWVRHLLSPVRFGDGVGVLLEDAGRVLVEVGPGDTLATLARQRPEARGRTILASMPCPEDGRSEVATWLAAAGDLWSYGVELDWEALHRGRRRRRLPLPTYPFERQRHWIESGERRDARIGDTIHKRPEMSEWFYGASWKRTPPVEAELPDDDGDPWLVFADRSGLAEVLTEAVRRSGGDVVEVRNGEEFSAEDGRYTVDAGDPEGYEALLAAVGDAVGLPSRVLHLCCDPETPVEEVLTGTLFLARAVARRALGEPVTLVLIGQGLNEVTGGDLAAPGVAAVLGLAKVISQEYPHLRCRLIDLPPIGLESSADESASRILAEVLSGEDEPMVAYRGGYRWVERFEPLRLPEADSRRRRRWGDGSHVLVTGGLGRFGLAVAEHLAHTRKDVALSLVDLEEAPADGEASASLARLAELGARVWVATVDVADRERMAEVVAEARRRHGPIDGVLHAAGHGGEKAFQTLEETDPGLCAAHLRPKAEGLRVVSALVAEDGPELCLVASSLAPLLGGVGLGAFAAADAVADALAQQAFARGSVPWCTVNWEGWEEVLESAGGGVLGQQQSELMMSLEEVIEAFERILAGPSVSRVVVATGDLEARIAQWTHVLEESPRPAVGRERSASVDFRPPAGDVEGRIAAIWRDALGVDPVGADDDFFELGGNSLIGLQILSRLRSEFHADLALRSFFEARTVAGMARVIESEREVADARYERIAAILEEVEALSEEEAEVLLGEAEGADRAREAS